MIPTIGAILIDIAAFVGFCAFVAFLMDKTNPEPGYVIAGCLILVVIGGMMGGAS